MSLSNGTKFDPSAPTFEAESTLRLIADLPAPQGIEERVKSSLRANSRRPNVIHWPSRAGIGGSWVHGSALKAAAAAAIVMVVGGGGWEVLSHIRVAPQPAAVAAPLPIDGRSGMSAAGAMRTPRTLASPLVPPAMAKQKTAHGATSLPAHPGKTTVKKMKL